MKDFKPSVFVIYGPPGSGKGTQANKIAEKFGFEHFNTGEVIEDTINDPEKLKDPIVRKQKENFETGDLCDPAWVSELVSKEIERMHEEGKGIVFSASPRTLYEAKKIMPLLEDLYGKENIYIFEIVVRPETSIYRNSHRRVCKDCDYSLVYTPENEKLKECPKCGGKLVTRVLDKPEIIKVRINKYIERTKPVYDFLKQRGFDIYKIDGEPSPEEVEKSIFNKINDKII
ncbi:MAG: AAA family ATPase [Candidatus Portnoybacteria bacterium]|nr:AAA family ATPase [Candidatus Portnoybacteria bacterium]